MQMQYDGDGEERRASGSLAERAGLQEPGSAAADDPEGASAAGQRDEDEDTRRNRELNDRVDQLIHKIRPTEHSEQRRNNVAQYVKGFVRKCFAPEAKMEAYMFGSVPLKTYLPDGDIDMSLFHLHPKPAPAGLKDTWAGRVAALLEKEAENPGARFKVQDVQVIYAEVKLLKCLVDNIVVDVSYNQLGGLCTLNFLECVDRRIGRSHLFKRSVILVKAWCYYESRLLGAHHALLSTYALETLVLFIFNAFHRELHTPLLVLQKFLDVFAAFDWSANCACLEGYIPLAALSAAASDPSAPPVTPEPFQRLLGPHDPDDDDDDHYEAMDPDSEQRPGRGFLLDDDFVQEMLRCYSPAASGRNRDDDGSNGGGGGDPIGSPRLPTAPSAGFLSKHMNISDVLLPSNNLGRSVSRASFARVRRAFSHGSSNLGAIMRSGTLEDLDRFFRNTWNAQRRRPTRSPHLQGNPQQQQQPQGSSSLGTGGSSHLNGLTAAVPHGVSMPNLPSSGLQGHFEAAAATQQQQQIAAVAAAAAIAARGTHVHGAAGVMMVPPPPPPPPRPQRPNSAPTSETSSAPSGNQQQQQQPDSAPGGGGNGGGSIAAAAQQQQQQRPRVSNSSEEDISGASTSAAAAAAVTSRTDDGSSSGPPPGPPSTSRPSSRTPPPPLMMPLLMPSAPAGSSWPPAHSFAGGFIPGLASPSGGPGNRSGHPAAAQGSLVPASRDANSTVAAAAAAAAVYFSSGALRIGGGGSQQPNFPGTPHPHLPPLPPAAAYMQHSPPGWLAPLEWEMMLRLGAGSLPDLLCGSIEQLTGELNAARQAANPQHSRHVVVQTFLLTPLERHLQQQRQAASFPLDPTLMGGMLPMDPRAMMDPASYGLMLASSWGATASSFAASAPPSAPPSAPQQQHNQQQQQQQHNQQQQQQQRRRSASPTSTHHVDSSAMSGWSSKSLDLPETARPSRGREQEAAGKGPAFEEKAAAPRGGSGASRSIGSQQSQPQGEEKEQQQQQQQGEGSKLKGAAAEAELEVDSVPGAPGSSASSSPVSSKPGSVSSTQGIPPSVAAVAAAAAAAAPGLSDLRRISSEPQFGAGRGRGGSVSQPPSAPSSNSGRTTTRKSAEADSSHRPSAAAAAASASAFVLAEEDFPSLGGGPGRPSAAGSGGGGPPHHRRAKSFIAAAQAPTQQQQ